MSIMDNVFFIEAVRKELCLWNPHIAEYRDMKMKDIAWNRVIKQCNNSRVPTVAAAKLEWKKLRDNHRDALKRAKLGKNKLLPAHITTWKYAKHMQFLEPHMKYRITESIDGELSGVASSPDFNVSTSSITEFSDSKEAINQDQPAETLYSDNSETKPLVQESDSLKLFFDSMLQSTRQMPLWMQTKVKKDMFAIIIDAEEQLSSQTNHSSCSPTEIGEMIPVETVIKSEYESEDEML